MSLAIKTTSEPNDPAGFIASSILRQLQQKKRVLFFLAGGSAISVALKAAELLKDHEMKNLAITLTDERYGPSGHADSNWRQLADKGFRLPSATLVPVLTGDDLETTVKKWSDVLEEEFEKADYKIGLFGIGKDGHTAGILPGSPALEAPGLAFGYKTEKFDRITLTPTAVEKFDEAVVWMQGRDKWQALENLEKDIAIMKQPAQILKKIPLLTIFTDCPEAEQSSLRDR